MKKFYTLLLLLSVSTISFSQVTSKQTLSTKKFVAGLLKIEHVQTETEGAVSQYVSVFFRDAQYAQLVEFGGTLFFNQTDLDQFISNLEVIAKNASEKKESSVKINDDLSIRSTTKYVFFNGQLGSYQTFSSKACMKIVAYMKTIKIVSFK